MKRYQPYGHGISMLAPAPWLQVKEIEDGREVTHDTDHCHCVKCCVAYRVKYQELSQTLTQLTRGDVSNVITTLADALTYIASLESTIGQIHEKVQKLDAMINQAAKDVNDLDRRSPMTAREELDQGPGAWLNRNEAWQVALEANQIHMTAGTTRGCLHSEDLW